MRDNTQAFAITDSGITERLTEAEVASMVEYCYATHDHLAMTPATPLFWWRVPRVGSTKWGAN